MPVFGRVTLRQIEYFVAVADHGSLRRAADQLAITQPTLTAQIAALEETLGAVLFERSRQGTWLTAGGRELLASARRVLEETQGLLDQAGTLSGGGVGTYRLGVTPTLGPYLLPWILPKLHSEIAGLRFYVREGVPRSLEEDLKDARHDLILTTVPVVSRELTVAPLFRESLRLAIPREHKLAKKPRINRMDLVGEEVLTIGEQYLLHRQIAELCEQLGAKLRRDYEGTSLDTLRQMVAMGMGLAFLPALYVRSEIRARDEVRITDVVGMNLSRQHALVWRPTSPARTLFRHLADRIPLIAAKHFGDAISPIKT